MFLKGIERTGKTSICSCGALGERAKHRYVDYLKRLKPVVLSAEYQTLREQAEAADDEKPVVDYLKAHGLWDQYETEREKLRTYAGNISDIKYLYIVVWGGKDSKYNMYLLDADDVPVYETGYYEEREKEFLGI